MWKLMKLGGPILVLSFLATSAQALQTSWNVEAEGWVHCAGKPMVGVQVDLMHSRTAGTDYFDTVMATAFTDDRGHYYLRGAGGTIFGPPAPYIRAVYFSPAAPPAPWPTNRITNELGSVRSDHGNTREYPYEPGVIYMGVQDFDTSDCRLWRESRNALGAYPQQVPYRDLAVMHWSAIYCCTPFATLETVAWPTNYSVSGTSMFHEVGHTFRHSLDGDFPHFLWDVLSYNYLRFHNRTDVTNEAFAFNEGWAEFWETLTRMPPAAAPFVNSPPNWSVEADVAAYLRSLWDCGLSPETLWQILHDHSYSIHSRDDFHKLLLRRFPRACQPPLPPPPSPPTACAAGKVSQQFYDLAVGCAGKVPPGDAANLCGKDFRLCGATELQTARRGLVTPTHNYWTSDPLEFDLLRGKCLARPSGWSPCITVPMHVCVGGDGTDPEGNTCAFVECTLDPPPGTEFLGNDFFGGCGAGNTTAGAVCCPVAAAGAMIAAEERAEEAVDEPAADGTMTRPEHRAALAAAIARLEAELAAARGRARLPASCPAGQPCPELYALIEPALLEGTLEAYRQEMARLDATPETIEELMRQGGEQGPESWQRAYAENWSREVLRALARALDKARAALQPAVAQASTAEAARLATADLEARRQEIERQLREPQAPRMLLPVFDPEKRR